MRVCKHSCDIFDWLGNRVEYFFVCFFYRVSLLIQTLGGPGEFLKVMQTLNCILGLYLTVLNSPLTPFVFR